MHVDNGVIVLAVLVLFAGIVALEMLLAKKGKKLGLVLPFASLGLSVIIFACTLAFASIGNSVVNRMITSPDVAVITPEPPGLFGLYSGDILQALLYFFLCNIFTAILFAAYFICRHIQRRRQALERMRVRDL